MDTLQNYSLPNSGRWEKCLFCLSCRPPCSVLNISCNVIAETLKEDEMINYYIQRFLYIFMRIKENKRANSIYSKVADLLPYYAIKFHHADNYSIFQIGGREFLVTRKIANNLQKK